MNLYSAFVYGIIQGFTEFLPVSSSAHLALLPILNHWKDPGVAFDLSMHIGTVLAVVLYFKSKIYDLFYDGYFFIVKKEVRENSYFFINLACSTFATVIFVLILKKTSFKIGRDIHLIIFNLIFFGIIMFISDKFFAKNKSQNLKQLNIKHSLIIGISQAFAIFPGVSRSGITLTSARFLKYSREDAASFSFLLSIPIILAGFIYELPTLVSSQDFSLQLCLTGILVSFVIGFLTIHFFLKILNKAGLWMFSVYRIILGIVLLYFFQ